MALAPRALLPPLAPSLTPTASQSRRLAWVVPGRCGCRRVCPKWQCGSSRHVRRWTPASGHQHRAWWRCFGAQKHVHEREQALNLTFEFEIHISSYRYRTMSAVVGNTRLHARCERLCNVTMRAIVFVLFLVALCSHLSGGRSLLSAADLANFVIVIPSSSNR